MTRPLIQVDDEVREMTDDEYQQHLETVKNAPAPLESPTDE